MIDLNQLEAKFARLGARLKVAEGIRPRFFNSDTSITLDVRNDHKGEFFEIIRRPGSQAGAVAEAEVEVLDVQPADRHLLLMVREGRGKSKFLCGHDERHWFIAAIPESAPVGTVRAAKEALKPVEVRNAQSLARLGIAAGNRRKNHAYRRQGEWFFIPSPGLLVDQQLVLRDEPISRGNGGKPHRCEYCYRAGGEVVRVCRRYPNGVSESHYQQILKQNREAKGWNWQIMRRNAEVFVRGRVRHADHKTITLHGWHRVLMNTENQAQAMRNVAFLD